MRRAMALHKHISESVKTGSETHRAAANAKMISEIQQAFAETEKQGADCPSEELKVVGFFDVLSRSLASLR